MAANLNVPARLINWLRAPAKLSNRRFTPISRIRLFWDNLVYVVCWLSVGVLILGFLAGITAGGVMLLSAGI